MFPVRFRIDSVNVSLLFADFRLSLASKQAQPLLM